MSHFVKHECLGLEDSGLLSQTLDDMGIKHERGTDLAIKGWGSTKDHVEIAIRRGAFGNSYDAGFKRNKNGGLELTSEDMDGKFNNKWIDSVKQAYNRRKALNIAKRNGYTLTKERKVAGKVQLTFSAGR